MCYVNCVLPLGGTQFLLCAVGQRISRQAVLGDCWRDAEVWSEDCLAESVEKLKRTFMDRIRSILVSVVLLCAAGASLSAQDEYTVSGRVVDQMGPVIGATVVEQGTSNGVSTDLDGSFALRVSGPDVMVEISCIGYAPQTYRASQVPETITLKEDSEFLDEVVVIGYGTVKKDDMTGSITAIKAEELNRGAVVNTQDLLKGKVPGLLVTPGDGGPGSGSRIRIRGSASLNASNDPLIQF